MDTETAPVDGGRAQQTLLPFYPPSARMATRNWARGSVKPVGAPFRGRPMPVSRRGYAQRETPEGDQ